MIAEPTSHAVDAFRERGGILRTKEALELGIHPRTLYRLRDEGALQQISRGVYRLAAMPDLSPPDLVTVALRVPRAVVGSAMAGRRAAPADASQFLNERTCYDRRLAVSEIGLPQSPVEDAVRRAVEEMPRERPAGVAPRDEAEEDAPAATPDNP